MNNGLTKEQLSKLSDEQKNNLIFSILHANEELTTRINDLEEILRLKSTKPFIPTSEQAGYLFDELEILSTPLEGEEEPKIAVRAHSRNVPHKVKELPSGTPVVVIDHTGGANDSHTDENGYEYVRIANREVDKIGVQPKRYYVERHVFPQYKLNGFEADRENGEKNIVTVFNNPVTDTLMAAPSLVAQVVVAKYADQLPLYRQEDIFRRECFAVNRQTLSQWLLKYSQVLEPLSRRLEHHILSSNLINQDETPVQVLSYPDSKPSDKHFMFIRVGTSIVSQKERHKIVLFTFISNRKNETLSKFSVSYDGYTMTDGLKGYLHLKNHLNCWVHAVRRFKEILKTNKKATNTRDIVDTVNKLYRIEDNLRKTYAEHFITADEFNELREMQTNKVFRELKEKLDFLRPKYAPKSAMGMAISYMYTYWDSLIRYPECFEATPDNNFAENAIRPFCLGRKNWLFSVSTQGAEASALYYSLIETAKANGINVYDYIWHVLSEAPRCKNDEDYDRLLPWNVDSESLAKMRNIRDSGKPDPARTEPYIFRGIRK